MQFSIRTSLVQQTDKPYLMSVGISAPTFGVYGHRYFGVRKLYPLKSKRFLGVRVVWTSYKRSLPMETEMQSGVYEHNRHPGNYYLLIGLAREHHGGAEFVVYVPLRVEPEWAGTARMALRSRLDFDVTFTHVGDRLPGGD